MSDKTAARTKAGATRPKPVIDLATARRVADELIELLRPACERIELAGSVRRRAPTVGDVEIVAEPRMLRASGGLFADLPGPEEDALTPLARELVARRVLDLRLDKNKTRRFGPRFKAVAFEGIAVDLFSCLAPSQWGVILAIRTGPADFAHQFVTHQGVTFRDWGGFRRAGTLPHHLRVHEGQVLLSPRDGGQPVVLATPEEVDFFRAVGLSYVPPEERR